MGTRYLERDQSNEIPFNHSWRQEGLKEAKRLKPFFLFAESCLNLDLQPNMPRRERVTVSRWTIDFWSNLKNNLLWPVKMSDLYRSAISARISKLPTHIPVHIDHGQDEDEEEDTGDTLGPLPGSGMGPPAMRVYFTMQISP